MQSRGIDPTGGLQQNQGYYICNAFNSHTYALLSFD